MTGVGWGDGSIFTSGRLSMQLADSESDHKTTHSSSFRATGSGMDMGKYGDLNLWLYENKHHAQLEEELYIKSRSNHNQSFVSKTTTNPNRSFLQVRERRGGGSKR